MKKINIHTNQIGLVFRKDELIRVLTKGVHRLGFFEEVSVYDMSQPFTSAYHTDILLQHEDFKNAVTVLNIADNELVLVYEGKNFKQVLTSGRHIYFKGLQEYTFITVNTDNYEIDPAIDRNLLDKQALANYVRSYRVEPHEQALMFVDGQFKQILDAGNYVFFKNSTNLQFVKTDMRQLSIDLSGQEILTKDKAQLRINFTFQYRVQDILKALLESKEFEKQLYTIMQLALREFVGKLSFDELLESKESLSDKVLEAATGNAAAMGVQLISCGVKDIILPGDVKEIMNQVLIAEKRAQANVITRREETASARSLLNTAKLMEENEMLYKLKEMEYVEKIAEKINNISVSGSGQIIDQLKQIFVKP